VRAIPLRAQQVSALERACEQIRETSAHAEPKPQRRQAGSLHSDSLYVLTHEQLATLFESAARIASESPPATLSAHASRLSSSLSSSAIDAPAQLVQPLQLQESRSLQSENRPPRSPRTPIAQLPVQPQRSRLNPTPHHAD
jgi:hypothetical protein